MTRQHQITPRECWVLFADNKPVGVFTQHRRAIIERLRLSKEQDEDGKVKLKFTLSDTITLMEDAP